jgi:lactoylglutathione lyase
MLPRTNTIRKGAGSMKYLHTMVRVTDLDESLRFYRDLLGLKETRRIENEKGRFTLVFLAPPGQEEAPIELTYNWDPEVYTGGRNFGHLAYEVENIYDFCDRLQKAGVTINRPPRDGHMAFIRSPDNVSIEILQAGERLPPQEPWASMANTGVW